MDKYSKKKDLTMQPSKNNYSTFVDNSSNEDQIRNANRIHYMNSIRSSKIGYLIYDVPYGSHVSFVPRSDLHYSTADPNVLDTLDNYFKNTVTTIFDHGDMLQVPVEGHHGGETQESKITTAEEQELFARRNALYADKIIGACGGTHDDPEFASRLSATYMSAVKPCYDKLNIPFFPNSLVIEYRVPVVLGKKIQGKTSLWCVVLHCSGKPSSKKLGSVDKTLNQGMGVVKKFNQEYGMDISPDFIIGGHFHANADADYVVEKTIYNEKGKATGTFLHTIRVRSGATLQSSNSSAFNRSFPEILYPNLTQYDVRFVKNNEFNENTFNRFPKYIPIATEFPILNRNGEFSKIAKEYMTNRKDYDFSTLIESTYKNSDLKSLTENFDKGL